MHVFSFGVKKHAAKCRFSWEKICDNHDNPFCRDLTIETGKLAKFADGAAVIKVMDT